ncbi:MAG: hypothetical protein KG075_17040 [Alphaproteobacteria bacterium]|nr:hypothetical protein [Alphaproteobacteria bacterium]
MDTNAIARRLSALGREEASALRMMERAQSRLADIASQRCAFLKTVASLPDAGLDDEAAAYVFRPKED